jgi:hypothetical protein
VAAEAHGKPEPEEMLRATGAKRRALLDRYREPELSDPGLTICMDIGCWEPAKETWDQFLGRKRRAKSGRTGGPLAP